MGWMVDKKSKYLVCNFYILQDIVTESDQFRFTSTSQTACSNRSLLLINVFVHWFIFIIVLNPVDKYLLSVY